MDPRVRYDDICDDLAARNAGAQLTRMMGMPCVKVDGKLIAGWVASEDGMVFKLPDEQAHANALRLDGAHLFEPRLEASPAKPAPPGRKTGVPSASLGGRGRPFREWVVVPAAHAAEWPRLAEQALRFRTAT